MCYKAIPWLLNFIILRIKHWPLSPIFHPFLSPTPSIPYPARHIPSFLIPPFPLTSPPPEGLGEAVFLWCLLFVFVNFFPSYFPIYALLRSKRCPFCNVKGHLLTCKRASFTTQKGTFYEPLCNLLILRRLQSWFFSLIVRFAIHMPLLFVRLFRNCEKYMLYRRQAALLPYRTGAFADQSTTIL